MATFGGERHVEMQLQSIAEQTLTPVEIVVGDDGSTDRTVDVIRKFAVSSSVPVNLTVNSERLGFGENFLRTASRARGRFIAFADQDDVWLPGRLAAAVSALSASDVTLWVSGWRAVDEDLVALPDRWIHTGLVERATIANPLGVVSGSRLVFRSDLLDILPSTNRPISLDGSGPASHDEWICFAARVLGSLAYSSKPLMLYRRHPGASTAENPANPSRSFLLSRAAEGSLAVRQRAALERAKYLRDRTALTNDPHIQDRLLAAAATYEELAPRLSRRAAADAFPKGKDRARNLLANAVRGDYRRLRDGGLGLWSLAQDLFAGF